MKPENGQRATWICAIVLALVTLGLFWPVTQATFIKLDDFDYVVGNDHIHHGVNGASLKWAFTEFHSSNWHPLTWISHMLDFQWFGLNAGGHHAVNMIFHVANAVLLFFVLMRLTGALWRSVIVAALFAWHPLHVESVAWVAERKDVLSTFFALLTLWFYAGYAERLNGEALQRGKAKWFFLWALGFFALGLLAKPMLVTLPLLLLLIDFWPLKRLESGKRFVPIVTEKIPFFVLSVLSSLMTLSAQKGAIRAMTHVPYLFRVENAGVSILEYIRKMFWPLDLAVIYPYPRALPIWQISMAVVLIFGVTICAVWFRKRAPFLAVGWFWFLISLIPVIGLVQVGIQAMADRYSYLPMIGLFIVLTWGVPLILPERFSSPVAAVALLACLLVTHFQLQFWQNGVVLFTRTIDVTTNNPMAYDGLAKELLARGDVKAAAGVYEEAIRQMPSEAELHNSLGELYMRSEKFAEAEEQFKQALALRGRIPKFLCNLAAALIGRERWMEAQQNLEEALRLSPKDPEAHIQMGNLYAGQKDSGQALKFYEEAIQLNPRDGAPYFRIGKLFARDNPRQAVGSFEKACDLDPQWVAPWRELGWLLATHSKAEVRSGTKAVEAAMRACELTSYEDPKCTAVLDAAYAEAGRFDEAIAMVQKTRELAARAEDSSSAAAAEQRLSLYQQQKAFHE